MSDDAVIEVRMSACGRVGVDRAEEDDLTGNLASLTLLKKEVEAMQPTLTRETEAFDQLSLAWRHPTPPFSYVRLGY